MKPLLERIFAQTGSQSSGHHCKFAHERNKAELEDYWSIASGDKLYTDKDFTADESALFWADIGEGKAGSNEFKWYRASEKLAGHSLFGSNGVTPEDVRQGALGNCWFLSAAAALAEEPGRIESVFVNDKASKNGIYAVNFYTLGVPHTVIIDDYLPIREVYNEDTDDYEWESYFAKMGPDNDIWFPLLEKAFAKYHGNY